MEGLSEWVQKCYCIPLNLGKLLTVFPATYRAEYKDNLQQMYAAQILHSDFLPDRKWKGFVSLCLRQKSLFSSERFVSVIWYVVTLAVFS